MRNVIVVGAGPAGLMAAQVLSEAGVAVTVLDAMPSAGRKFLMAGKGGLNLTHSESTDRFLARYGARQAVLQPMLQNFGVQAVRDWALSLGQPTFVGSSGRVFPVSMKAAPLLRTWLHRLRSDHHGMPVKFMMRSRWMGWPDDPFVPTRLQFQTEQGQTTLQADATVLALGGGSWSRLGSDGSWVSVLRQRGVAVAALLPANCGFDVKGRWSAFLAQRHAGHPLKLVALTVRTPQGDFRQRGECVVTATGLEGSLIYAASALLRNHIMARGQVTCSLDLIPDRTPEQVLSEVAHPRGSRSLSNHLKSRLPLDDVKLALLHECLTKTQLYDPIALAAAIKALPITFSAARPLDEAISSAGGVCFETLNDGLMVTQLPGVFCAGEMLDWEAPTGGYLLTASLATGACAAHGVLRYLEGRI